MRVNLLRLVGLAPLTALLALLAAALLTAPGCGGTADLEPAPGALTVDGVAIDDVAGVHVGVRAGAWPGEAPISREVTPLEITIENGSGGPLRVAYDIFSLVGGRGRTYAVLPPFEVGGAVPNVMVGFDPLRVPPGFQQRGFLVAPYLASAYDMAVAHTPFYHDPVPRRGWADHEGVTTLPTPEMLRLALPEGELEDGGFVKGWLYFERVDPDARRLVFRADLVRAGDRRELGRIFIPFDVEQE